jgi:HSP20 family protein
MAQVPVTQRNQGGLARRGDLPFERLRRDFDALLSPFWKGWLASEPDFSSMRLWDFDVQENDREIMIRAELPGFEEKELDVQLSNDTLTIKAEKEQNSGEEQEYRRFFRSFTLPGAIDANKVKANYRNGVLTLRVPCAEGSQPKRIPVMGQEQAQAGDQAQTARQAKISGAEKTKK